MSIDPRNYGFSDAEADKIEKIFATRIQEIAKEQRQVEEFTWEMYLAGDILCQEARKMTRCIPSQIGKQAEKVEVAVRNYHKIIFRLSDFLKERGRQLAKKE